MRSGYFTPLLSAPGSINHTNPTNILKSESKISNASVGRTLSSSLIDTYYIWSHDGKLLAEYDQNGNCVRDYIYLGNKLLAEYHPQTGKYYYHMQDQINSTRIVIDDDGNVVYSAAHGPYGDIQKEWVNTYDPKQKFSGKERENYSDLDYFGARYYNHLSYRFISIDPIINKEEALSNPQLWNLYSYCGSNPITNVDPDGRELRTTCLNTMQQIAGAAASKLAIVAGKLDVSGFTHNDLVNNEGANLLYQLASSQKVYSYAEGTTINTAAGPKSLNAGVENLDVNPDWRYPSGKSPQELPPSGIHAAVAINPNYNYVDAATGNLAVSHAAVAFHELAEAYGKIDQGMQAYPRSGGYGAHQYAVQRERVLIGQRPSFTQYPAGGRIRRR